MCPRRGLEDGSQAGDPGRKQRGSRRLSGLIYIDLHHVENAWARLDDWRTVATRYEKTATSSLGVLCLAAAAQ